MFRLCGVGVSERGYKGAYKVYSQDYYSNGHLERRTEGREGGKCGRQEHA